MAAKFLLEILTPEKLLFSGEVESLIVQHPSGKEGYLAFHEPVLKEISPGIITYKSSDTSSEELEVKGGFISFENNKAIIFIR